MLAGTHHVLFLSTLWMLPINKSILKAALSHLNFPSDLISLSYRSEFQLLTEGVSSLSVWAGSPGVGFCGAETHQLSHGHWAPSKWGEVWDKEGTSSLFHGKLNIFFFFTTAGLSLRNVSTKSCSRCKELADAKSIWVISGTYRLHRNSRNFFFQIIISPQTSGDESVSFQSY